jgi:15-cis-phytoene synthase
MAATVQSAVKPPRPHRMQLRAAYSICRGIARSAAKNFYYGFLVLPQHKRNALSAVYAFMRHADDISDNDIPGLSIAQKRQALSDWQDALHRTVAGQSTDDPVLLAVADTQRRYKIPLELLDQLVIGTAMDLSEDIPLVAVPRPLNAPPPVAMHGTFEDLYRYCYHVASVVGLVTIRIFGYTDPAAEKLAEHTGVAFQLTNILRDVKEDALRGRIYLPADDLARHRLRASDFINLRDPAKLRPLLAKYAVRTRKFYESAERLLPLIDEDSRPALWALVEIYSRLLDRIVASNYDVYGEKVRVPTSQKLAVLTRGLLRRLK